MIKKFSLFTGIIIFLATTFVQTYSIIKRRTQTNNDQQITTLVQKVYYSPEQEYQKILAKNKEGLTFTAKYNNLGTIAILFNNYKKINSDWVWFRIKEEGSNRWYYENRYNTDQFNPEIYFTFGFPVIGNSESKRYLIEVESISGTLGDSISFNAQSKNYIAKYSYSKSYLVNNKKQIPLYIANRVKAYLDYISKSDVIRIILKSSSLLFLYLIIPYNSQSYKKYIASLKKRRKNNNLLKQFTSLTIIFNPVRIYNLIKGLENNYKINKFFNVFIPVIMFLLTFAIAGYFSTIGADPHHDGILLKPAIDLASGKILFKETFTQYGALTTIIQALSLKIFGHYLITIRLLTAFFYGLISVLLYLIYKRLLPKLILFCCLIVWLLTAPYYIVTFLPWSSIYSLFFQLLTAYLLIMFYENKLQIYFTLASISTALIFWCRQPVGVFTFLAIIAYFIYLYLVKQINRKLLNKYLKDFIIMNLAVFLIFILYFIISNSLVDWYKQSILMAYLFGESFEGGFNISLIIKTLFPFSNSPLSIWILIPTFTLFLQITNHKNKILSLLIFIGLSSWLQYYPVSDIRHQYWAATPMYPLLGLFIYEFFQRYLLSIFHLHKITTKYLTTLIIIIIFIPDISYRFKQGLLRLNSSYQYIQQPVILRGIKLNHNEAEYYQYMSKEFSDYFQKNPNGNVVTNGTNSLYLTFDSRIKNIHPMYVNWGTAVHILYPNYATVVYNYYLNSKPMLVSMWDQLPQEYCRLDDKSNLDTAALAQLCD